MQIAINKDFEEEYKDEFTKGLTLRETVHLVLCFGIVAGITFLAWWQFDVYPDTGVFFGLPFGIPVLYVGFKKYQGLTVPAYVKEMLYEYRTRELVYDADELPKEHHVFTLGRVKEEKRGGLGRWIRS